MSIQEYRSKRNRTWENQGLTLQEFAAKLNPYLGGTYKNIGDSGAATTIDWANAKVQELNLNESPTLTFANGIEGSELTLLLASDNTQRAVNWPSDVTWSQNIEPTIATAQLGGSKIASPPVPTMASTGFNGAVTFVKALSTGKILVSGQFSSYSGTYTGPFVRLNPDLTLDYTFVLNTFSLPYNVCVKDALELSNGNVIIVGWFNNGGNISLYGNTALQLLSPNGTRIYTNQVFTNFADRINTIGVQSNGKLIVAGVFVYGTFENIARIETDYNNFDSTFNVTLNQPVLSLVVKPDDTIYLGGFFTTINGFPLLNNGLGALTANGLPVSYFQPVLSPGGGINTLLLSDAGEIYAGGSFTALGGAKVNLIKFTNVGGYDASFVGYGTDGEVNDIALTVDGTIIIVGAFTQYNFIVAGKMAFIDQDGSINTNFVNPAGILSSTGNQVAISSSNDLFIGGEFDYYNQDFSTSIGKIVKAIGLPQDFAYTKVDFQYNGNKYIGSF